MDSLSSVHWAIIELSDYLSGEEDEEMELEQAEEPMDLQTINLQSSFPVATTVEAEFIANPRQLQQEVFPITHPIMEEAILQVEQRNDDMQQVNNTSSARGQ